MEPRKVLAPRIRPIGTCTGIRIGSSSASLRPPQVAGLGQRRDRACPPHGALCAKKRRILSLVSRGTWKLQDPLFRGDSATAITAPSPAASKNVVRHILYLEGAGRETPYLSASEMVEAAESFAGSDGAVWRTSVTVARSHRVTHLSNKELMGLLKGKGKGRAEWRSAIEVAQARRYVEEWAEHLLDFSSVGSDLNAAETAATIFTRGKGRQS